MTHGARQVYLAAALPCCLFHVNDWLSAGDTFPAPNYKKERRISFDEFPFIAPEDGWVRCSGIGYGGTGWSLLADGMIIFHYSSAASGGSTSATVSPVKKELFFELFVITLM